MGAENLEDVVHDADYQNALLVMDLAINAYERLEMYEEAKKMYNSWKRVSEDYIDFRLDRFDSEGRQVVSQVYFKILKYNPHNPRQIGE